MNLRDVQRELDALLAMIARQPAEPPIVRRILGGFVSRRLRQAEMEAMDGVEKGDLT